jgi:glucose/arabinose dehydrogenase
MSRRSQRFSSALALSLAVVGCKDDTSGSEAADASDSQAMTTTTTGPATDTSSSTTSSDTEPTGVDSTGDTGPIACPHTPVEGQPGVQLELVAGGFDRPVLVVGHPTEPERLFVVEQGGTVRILEPGMTEAPAEAFLHIEVSNAVNSNIGNERGLLGFDLHPNFPDEPKVYVAYNPNDGGSPPTVVEEFAVGDDGRADLSSRRVIISADQPAGNHNGGMIAFGPDGYLYFGTGDGGGSGDPYATGRDPSFILGKMLRIGVEPDGQPNNPVACGQSCGTQGPFDYTIPADNPFVDDEAFAPEVWAWGFRNPWRFSFDPQTGDLYVADVGQNAWEEVSLAVAGGDYGWSDMEGFHCYGGAQCDESPGPNEVNAQGMTMPLVEYSISGSRCSIIGLGVYRSCEVPSWDGLYFYGDYCTGEAFALAWDGQSVTDLGTVWTTNAGDRLLGGGNNAHGDVFVTSVIVPFSGAPIEDGRVYRIAPSG